jgi:hypothetical protein
MFCSVKLMKYKVMIPTYAHIQPSGGHKLVAPIAFLPVSDANRLKEAVIRNYASGHPNFNLLSDEEKLSGRIAMQLAGVKSWTALDRAIEGNWDLTDYEGGYRIIVNERAPGAGWIPGPERIAFPAGTPLETVCDHLIAMIQTKAAATPPRPS